eukprot:TRINITY_DN72712_c0_g1_i1.p1 TRINITY_DN72712_c0_g1~~TRINITY_DN72712_c0_g1_i1.p1  ORF type:complete len:482 (+),score=17.61 TRINITY_DN72712_c0_g1_i1:155-1600(+)
MVKIAFKKEVSNRFWLEPPLLESPLMKKLLSWMNIFAKESDNNSTKASFFIGCFAIYFAVEYIDLALLISALSHNKAILEEENASLLVQGDIAICFYKALCFGVWYMCRRSSNCISSRKQAFIVQCTVLIGYLSAQYSRLFFRIIYYCQIDAPNDLSLYLLITCVCEFVFGFHYTVLPIFAMIVLLPHFPRWVYKKMQPSPYSLKVEISGRRATTMKWCCICKRFTSRLFVSKYTAFHEECFERMVQSKNIAAILYYMGIEHNDEYFRYLEVNGKCIAGLNVTAMDMKALLNLEVPDIFPKQTQPAFYFHKEKLGVLLTNNGTVHENLDFESFQTYTFSIQEYTLFIAKTINKVLYYSPYEGQPVYKFNPATKRSHKVKVSRDFVVIENRYFIAVKAISSYRAFLELSDLFDEEAGLQKIYITEINFKSIFTAKRMKVVRPGLVQISKNQLFDLTKKKVIIDYSAQLNIPIQYLHNALLCP